MQDVGWAALQIIPSFDGLEGRLERGTRGPLGSAGTKGGRVFGDSAGRSLTSAISSHAKKAALIAAGAFSAAAAGGLILVRSSFEEARESQKVAALTAAVIKSTGGAAEVTAKHVDKLSYSIGKKAAIDDETVASGLNMLLTFKNVRNEVGKGNKIFDQAGRRITDMAAAMAASSGGEVDLKSASILVGKALNDPVRGLTALHRVGVDFTAQQTDQIKAMVASGDVLGAQKIILGELTTEFKGAAKSQATDADKLSFAWHNVEEKLGTALLPLMDDFTRFLRRDGIPVAEHWVDVFQDKGVPALKHFFDKAKPVAEDVLPKLESILGTVADDLKIAAPYAKDLVDAFIDMPDWAKKVIVGGGLAAFAAKKTGVTSLLGSGSGGSGLLGLASKARPLPVFVVNEGFGGAPGLPGGTRGGKPSTPLLGAPILPGAFPDHQPGPISDSELKRQLALPEAQKAILRDRYNNPLTSWVHEFKQDVLNAQRTKIQPTFDILGMVAADGKIAKLRAKAEKPIILKLIPELQSSIGELFSDAFGGGAPQQGGAEVPGTSAHPKGRGGVTINVDKVMPQNYREFMTQMQQRSNMAQTDGVSR